jgi:hypothetical protein
MDDGGRTYLVSKNKWEGWKTRARWLECDMQRKAYRCG